MSEKEWSCPNCGVVHDRDINAAKNLQKMSQKYIEDVKKEALEVIEWNQMLYFTTQKASFMFSYKELYSHQIKAPV